MKPHPKHPLLLLTLLACCGAQAADSPYYFGGALGVTHVSNIYRSADTTPQSSDNVLTATLLAGIDQHLGRQRLYGDASLYNSRYQDNASLSNNGYNFNLGLDWQTIERLSGTVAVSSSRSLAQFNPGNAPVLTSKNVQQANQARAVIRYGLVSKFTLEGSFSFNRVDYSAAEYDPYENTQHSSSLGVVYRPGEQLSLGVAVRRTDGEFPRYRLVSGSYLPDEISGTTLDLTSTWTPSAASSLQGRVSLGKRSHSTVGIPDFSGVTGALSWHWLPTSKLTVDSSLVRDVGTDSTLYNVGSLGNFVSDYSTVINTLRASASYALTAKIALDAGMSLSNRDISSSFGGSALSGSDRSVGINLGVRWLFMRNGQLNCSMTKDRRSSSQFVLSQPYDANSYGCAVQMVIR